MRAPSPAKPVSGLVACLWLAGALPGCNGDTPSEPGPSPITFDLDFTSETHGWKAGFSDFNVGDEEQMELAGGHEPLPAEVGQEGRGLFVGATNRSDDVFMFRTGRVDGLEPETTYGVSFLVEFATEAPSGCVGVGGAPGESVHLKVGATPVEPEPVVDDGYYQMNIDKGNQFASGSDAIRIGDVANSNTDCLDWVWEMKSVESDDPFEARADSDGGVWLLVGTDSGFEARTELFYTRYRAVFQPI
jgi:hypothetical protein